MAASARGLLVCGGEKPGWNGDLDTVKDFMPDTVEELRGGVWTPLSRRMPGPRVEAGAVAAGAIYVVGGYDTSDRATSSVQVLDGEEWRQDPHALPYEILCPAVCVTPWPEAE